MPAAGRELGIRNILTHKRACKGRFLVRIRVYGIIGFSGFARRASLTGKRSFVFVLSEFPVMAKIASWAKVKS